jgi:hypothetical protein
VLAAAAAIGLIALAVVLVTGDPDIEPRDGADTSLESTPTGRTTDPTTATTVDPEQALRTEVMAAYDAQSDAFFQAAGIPDPDHPALAATHTQPMLGTTRALIVGLLGDGRIMRLPPDSQYRNEVESVEFPPEYDGTVAILTVCTVDDGEIVELATGRVVAGGAGTVESRAAMRLEAGVWKLAEREELARWPGVAGCAA